MSCSSPHYGRVGHRAVKRQDRLTVPSTASWSAWSNGEKFYDFFTPANVAEALLDAVQYCHVHFHESGTPTMNTLVPSVLCFILVCLATY